MNDNPSIYNKGTLDRLINILSMIVDTSGLKVSGVTIAGNLSGVATEATLGDVHATSVLLLNQLQAISTGTAMNSNSLTQFTRNGSLATVVEDTITPTNNRPLPVKLSSVTGDINITAGDLNVQLSDSGLNYDITRVGDGTGHYQSFTASNEAKVVIDNSTGASAVNIQDGGNSITVDGTVTSKLQDASGNNIGSTSNALDINIKSGSIANTAFSVNNSTGASAVNIQDGGNSITVDGTVSIIVAASNQFRNTAVTTKQQVVGSSSTLNGWNIINPNSYAVYLKFYNILAASVTVGTSAVSKTLMIPANGSVVNDGASHLFNTAMTIAATKLIADSDTTAVDTGIYVGLSYTQ